MSRFYRAGRFVWSVGGPGEREVSSEKFHQMLREARVREIEKAAEAVRRLGERLRKLPAPLVEQEIQGATSERRERDGLLSQIGQVLALELRRRQVEEVRRRARRGVAEVGGVPVTHQHSFEREYRGYLACDRCAQLRARVRGRPGELRKLTDAESKVLGEQVRGGILRDRPRRD